jgi:hypothetical protein
LKRRFYYNNAVKNTAGGRNHDSAERLAGGI